MNNKTDNYLPWITTFVRNLTNVHESPPFFFSKLVFKHEIKICIFWWFFRHFNIDTLLIFVFNNKIMKLSPRDIIFIMKNQ